MGIVVGLSQFHFTWHVRIIFFFNLWFCYGLKSYWVKGFWSWFCSWLNWVFHGLTCIPWALGIPVICACFPFLKFFAVGNFKFFCFRRFTYIYIYISIIFKNWSSDSCCSCECCSPCNLVALFGTDKAYECTSLHPFHVAAWHFLLSCSWLRVAFTLEGRSYMDNCIFLDSRGSTCSLLSLFWLSQVLFGLQNNLHGANGFLVELLNTWYNWKLNWNLIE